MIGDTYAGGTMWGVRWGEAGTPATCREAADESQARALHAHLTTRYAELGRADAPELLRARIMWEVVAADTAPYPPNVQCVCGDLIHPDMPQVITQPDGFLWHGNAEGGGHRSDATVG
ncbi:MULTISPECIES: hypothetical protein [Mycolicibacterium]|uniref:hypothetical protein n=1 Tax=Mycolicibacterium TaxID=1866885 RepID=UPI001CDB926D|nr:hypothetical protein [Mycolicibacterium fortuitum]UBV20332.1 hypothetical protein H8Z59_24115 [Mycolicibacterium fortuitum]